MIRAWLGDRLSPHYIDIKTGYKCTKNVSHKEKRETNS